MRIRSAVLVALVTTTSAVAFAAPTPPKLRLDDSARPTKYAARITRQSGRSDVQGIDRHRSQDQ